MRLWIALGVPLLLSLMVFFVVGTMPAKKCALEKTVVSILSVEYRNAIIKYTDGSTQVVYQDTVKPGDVRCVAWY